jgi:SH3 domain protein
LTQKYAAIETKHITLSEEKTRLQETVQRLTKDMQTSAKAMKGLQKEYDTLKSGSADYIKLKSEHQKTSAQLTDQTKRANKFEEELTKLLRNQNIKWFLSGAGVLILGFIIGYSSKRTRRRSSLL